MEKKKIVVSQTLEAFEVDLITVKEGEVADELDEFVGAEELGIKKTREKAFEFAREESKRLGVELKSLE